MMTRGDLLARLKAIEQMMEEIKAELAGTEYTAPVAPTYPPYELDEKRRLKGTVPMAGNYLACDPVIGENCPIGVKVKSGAILSEPRPDLGETAVSYMWRVALQACKGDKARADQVLTNAGSLFMMATSMLERFHADQTGKGWPEAADFWCNREVYLTDEEKAADAKAKADWAVVAERMKQNAENPTPTPPADQEVPIQ